MMDVRCDKKLKNLAVSQFYRVLEVYETDYTETTLYNHLSLIDDQFVSYYTDGIWKGKASHLQRLSILKNWKHANHILGYNFKKLSESELSLTVDALYQNVLPDGTVTNYNVTHFNRFLVTPENIYLKETKILNSLIEGAQSFEPSYLKNRAAALVHKWLYLIENIKYKDTSFIEMFAPKFRLSTDVIFENQNNDEIKFQLSEMYDLSTQTCFDVQNIALRNVDKGRIEINAIVKSCSDTPKSNEFTIQHRWLVEQDSEKPFMKIHAFDILDIRPVMA